MKEKILIGLSGGTDSAYTVELLRRDGFEPVGAFLYMHDHAPLDEARKAAEKLKIEFHAVDCRKTFRDTVIKNFIDEYVSGRTPNPCAFCNPNVKFKKLIETADELKIEKVATGHYARVEYNRESGRYCIKKGVYEAKDQSYVLWRLSQEQLSRLVLPMGDKEKKEAADFVLSEKILDKVEESMEICFIPDNDYRAFLMRNSEDRNAFLEGDFVGPDGKPAGKHKGIAFYTVGQRKGLGIALGKPVYVKKIDPVDRKIYLGFAGEGTSGELSVSCLNFVSLAPANNEIEAECKIRYKAKPEKARVSFTENGAEASFSIPPKAATPGQSAVFYRGEELLFGGVID